MDVIDRLAGIAPGSPLDAVRDGRSIARVHAQRSFEVLLTPAEPGEFTLAERFAIATCVAGLHRAEPTAGHYASGLATHGGAALAETVAAAVAATLAAPLAEGPRGAYPPGPLSVEDTPAPAFVLPPAVAEGLGPKLAAGFAQAHYLVFHPRDAAAARFTPLMAAGWDANAIVSLSQLVAFLTFQIRVVAGLSVLAATR